MKKLLCSILLISSVYGSTAQDFLQSFKASSDSLKRHVYFLASDSLQGRKAGSNGQKIAASYIATRFKSLGLSTISPNTQTPYYQTFNLYSAPIGSQNATITIKGSSTKLNPFADIMFLSGVSIANTQITPYFGKTSPTDSNACFAPVITAESVTDGLTKIAELGGKEVKGSFFVVVPTTQYVDFANGRFAFLMPLMQSTNNAGDTSFYGMYSRPYLAKENTYYTKVIPFLQKHPNVSILLCDDHFLKKMFSKEVMEEYPRVANQAVGKYVEVKGTYLADAMRKVSTENVVGIFEGTSKKDEAIIVCAHYDHIGITASMGRGEVDKADSINNGADDNASGTAAVLEIARLLTLAKSQGHAPSRTIIVTTFTAEELGLYGSTYMCSHPVFPLAKTVAVVNLDMVGRTNETHTDSEMYAYALTLGKSTGNLTKPLSQSAKLADIDITSPISERERDLWTSGSDHASFVKRGIPSIVMTTGEHADYHTPADEANRISYPRLTRIATFAFYTVWKLANQ